MTCVRQHCGLRATDSAGGRDGRRAPLCAGGRAGALRQRRCGAAPAPGRCPCDRRRLHPLSPRGAQGADLSRPARSSVGHVSQRQPLVLAVEDVHWIDATSEAWLTTLVERLAGTPLLLLVTLPARVSAPLARAVECDPGGAAAADAPGESAGGAGRAADGDGCRRRWATRL